jgi:hypothetical protein
MILHTALWLWNYYTPKVLWNMSAVHGIGPCCWPVCSQLLKRWFSHTQVCLLQEPAKLNVIPCWSNPREVWPTSKFTTQLKYESLAWTTNDLEQAKSIKPQEPQCSSITSIFLFIHSAWFFRYVWLLLAVSSSQDMLLCLSLYLGTGRLVLWELPNLSLLFSTILRGDSGKTWCGGGREGHWAVFVTVLLVFWPEHKRYQSKLHLNWLPI